MALAGQFVADLRVVLRRRDFRRLFATRLVSQGGDGVFEAGLASLFFFSPQRAATGAGIAAAFAVALLPYTLVGPFAGVLLDRWRRRQVLVVVNLLRGVLVVALAGAVAAGAVGWPLYVAVLGCLSVNRFFLAGLGASLPHVVPRDELVMANAVSPTSGTLFVLLGGGLGFGIRQWLGAGDSTDAVILLLAAMAYLVAAAVARLMAVDLLGPPVTDRPPWPVIAVAARAVIHGLGDAALHLRRRRPAFDALVVIGAQRFGFGLVTVAVVLLSRGSFADPADPDAGAARLAAIAAASGAGFVIAAAATPVATRRLRPQAWMAVCSLAAAVLCAAFAARPTFAAAVVIGLGLGVALQGTKICVDAVVQATVADVFRGRAMSFYDMVFNLAFVVAAAIAAVMLPPDGRSTVLFLVVTGVYLLAAAGAARADR